MDQEERNKRKQKWMAHGFGIALGLRNASDNIYTIMNDVSVSGKNEFDAYTEVIEQLETVLHDCGIPAFSEKFLIFMLLNAKIPNDKL